MRHAPAAILVVLLTPISELAWSQFVAHARLADEAVDRAERWGATKPPSSMNSDWRTAGTPHGRTTTTAVTAPKSDY